MSEWPSPLKSPVPTAFQAGPGLEASAGCRRRSAWPRSFPRSRLARSCSGTDVGMAVAVEIAGSDRLPARPGIGADEAAAAGDLVDPVHLPDRDLAARILPQDVGQAVAVEVAGPDRFPTWPGVGADPLPPPITLVPFISQIAAWPSPAFCKRMSACPSPLKSPVPISVQLGPGLGPADPPPIRLVPFISQIAPWPVVFATGCRTGRRH